MTGKKIFLFVTVFSLICLSTSAFAAAWNAPNNVRIVQKSNVDNNRIFSTIQAAMNSIPASSPTSTNPYLIKIMPGVYDLGTESLQMREYVNLEGSGPENTVITSAVPETANFECAVGTIIMTNNTVLRHITVKNSYTASAFSDVQVSAIAFPDVKATVDGVSLISSGVNANRTDGICITGPNGNVDLKNSYVETSATGGNQSNTIFAENGATLTMTNSRLLGIGNGSASIDVINCNWAGPGGPGKAFLSDSIIESSGNVYGTYLVNGESCNIALVNSKLIAGTTPVCSINVGTDGGTPYGFKIVNSQLPGGAASMCGDVPSAKLLNNYDENFNAIPNQ